MFSRIASLIRRADRSADGYSRELQAARLRASYQRAYFAPALFNLVPVKTDLIASMAVDVNWRLYYNESWVATHSVEENASLLIHEVSHLLREHDARKRAAAVRDSYTWNTAADCEINDDLAAEGLPLPGDPPQPEKYGLPAGENAELYYRHLYKPPKEEEKESRRAGEGEHDCGSGAHGDRRPWEVPNDEGSSGGTPGVDATKAEIVRRDVARRIMDTTGLGDVPLAWRRWAHRVLSPRVDYMAIIRQSVRAALRDSTLRRYDRTYRRPHRRQACYGNFIMPSFYQPRARPGFLIDTSSSMQDDQLSRAVAELAGLTRQLGYGSEVVVACCDAAVHQVKRVFNAAQLQLYGGGGTDIRAGIDYFTAPATPPIDLLVIVSDCETPWPPDPPPFPVITVRVGAGEPPSWGESGRNKVITIEEPEESFKKADRQRKRRWRADH